MKYIVLDQVKIYASNMGKYYEYNDQVKFMLHPSDKIWAIYIYILYLCIYNELWCVLQYISPDII